MRAFYQRVDLGGEYTIEGDGTVNLPRLGRIRMTGRTAEEIRQEIASDLQKDSAGPPISTLQSWNDSRSMWSATFASPAPSSLRRRNDGYSGNRACRWHRAGDAAWIDPVLMQAASVRGRPSHAADLQASLQGEQHFKAQGTASA